MPKEVKKSPEGQGKCSTGQVCLRPHTDLRVREGGHHDPRTARAKAQKLILLEVGP